MKSTLATALSLAAVLSAGAVAAAANLRVFAGPSSALDTASIAPQPATGDPGTSQADAVGVQMFQVGEAGTVTLDPTGGLHLLAADPDPGWRARPRPGTAGTVVVDFVASPHRTVTATAVQTPEGVRVTVADTADGGGRRHRPYDEPAADAEDD